MGKYVHAIDGNNLLCCNFEKNSPETILTIPLTPLMVPAGISRLTTFLNIITTVHSVRSHSNLKFILQTKMLGCCQGFQEFLGQDKRGAFAVPLLCDPVETLSIACILTVVKYSQILYPKKQIFSGGAYPQTP